MNGPSPAKRSAPGWANFAIDFGPLLAFFIGFKAAGIFVGTAIFMVAIIVAIIAGLIVFRRVSQMLWLSAILIIGFGGLTLYLHDATFIQVKPTVIYVGLGGLLIGGGLLGKPLLKPLLGYAFPGLRESGWLILSRNWGLYFLGLAIANEIMRRTMSFDAWLTAKVWGVTALSLLFGISNMPMLLKHGLEAEEGPPAPPPVE
jgi:intracellular septation protein